MSGPPPPFDFFGGAKHPHLNLNLSRLNLYPRSLREQAPHLLIKLEPSCPAVLAPVRPSLFLPSRFHAILTPSSLHGATESANPGVPIPILHLKEPPSTSSKARLLEPKFTPCQSSLAVCCICRFYSSSDDLPPLPSIIHSTASTGFSPQSIKLSVPGLNNNSPHSTFTSSSRTLLHCTHNPVLQRPNYVLGAKVRYKFLLGPLLLTRYHISRFSVSRSTRLLPTSEHTFFDILCQPPFKNRLQSQRKLRLTRSFTHLSSSRCGASPP